MVVSMRQRGAKAETKPLIQGSSDPFAALEVSSGLKASCARPSQNGAQSMLRHLVRICRCLTLWDLLWVLKQAM